MKVKAISTSVFSQGENLLDFILDHSQKDLKENSILAVTSKVVSLAENRTISKEKVDKLELIKKECEYYIGEIGYNCHLTIQQGLLVPSAGVDESNSEKGEYILYPKDPFASAEKLCKSIKQKLSLKNFAVLITDSRTFPLRRGVIGVALAYSGLKAVKSLIGKEDLFGRPLKMTTINIVDALASAAVLMMGEGAEKCPLAVIDSVPLVFTEKTDPSELKISIEKDLYSPLYKHYIS